MSALRQFGLLFWKNWLLQKRSVWLTLFEIGLPTLFALILVLIRQDVEVTRYTEPRTWPDFPVDRWPPILELSPRIPWQVAYTPNNAVTQKLMSTVRGRLQLADQDMAFDTEEELVEALRSSSLPLNVWGGIVFTGEFPADGTLPKSVSYKIRPLQKSHSNPSLFGQQVTQDWLTNLFYPAFQIPGPRDREYDTGGIPNYYDEGFLALQRNLDYAIVQEADGGYVNGTQDQIQVTLERFPYPPYQDDMYVFVIQIQFPFILLLSFIVTAPSITKDIVLEKERKLKEFMKMMGLRNWLHWTAWYAKYALFMVISVLIMVLLFCVPIGPAAVINNIDPSLLFVFLMLYALSTISFCFAVSVFFKKANSGAAAGGILFFLTYVPCFFFQLDYQNMSLATKWGASLLHNVAMMLGCTQVASYEGSGAGLQWSNFYKPVSPDENFTMLDVFIMFIVDIFVYGLITWYFDNVMPGDFGIPKPLYFPFTKTYWCGGTSGVIDEYESSIEGHIDREYFELEPNTGTNKGIMIRNLRKVFVRGRVKKVAVTGTYLDINEGQITALLGHNGAGKTTTMSMLTGFLPPTSGTAIINGLDIRHDIDAVRRNIGLCPQHNILYDDLTVHEHLIFYSNLKGFYGSAVKKEVDDMIALLHLEDKRDARSKSLSGGMKRKLHCGIALVGGSKIVMLDEPTSGMDPEARRQMWDILQSQREGRTMILSTHFMDEADLLGDRIAIMANGQVKCYGSSMFLKGKYGVGYHMVMVKEEQCDVARVTDSIMSYVPTAQLESNVSAELSFILPAECVGQFEAMFTFLEEHKQDLGIASFGASVTTMEEVFLKVGEEAENEIQASDDPDGDQNHVQAANGHSNSAFEHDVPIAYADDMPRDGDVSEEARTAESDRNGYGTVTFNNHAYLEDTTDSMQVSIVPDRGMERRRSSLLGRATLQRALSIEEHWKLTPVMGEDLKKHAGMKLYTQQFKAMFIKRALHSWRNRLVTVTQLFTPIFFTIMAGIVLKTLPTPGDPPAMELSLGVLPEQHVAYTTNDTYSGTFVNNLTSGMLHALNDQVEKFDWVNKIPPYDSNPDINKYIGDIGLESMDDYNRKYTFAAEFIGNDTLAGNPFVSFIGLFNNQGYHTVAVAVNAIGNSILNMFTNSSDTITAWNHPVPKSDSQKLDDEINQSTSLAFMISTNVQFGMAFLVGTFVVFLIKERTLKAKHVQFVSGVHAVNFWLSTFCWDMINYLIAAYLLLPVFAAFDFEPYITGYNSVYVLLMLFLFGWSILPFTYLVSYLFSVPASGYVWTTVLNMFTGIAAVMAVFILRIPQLNTLDVAVALEWVFYIIMPNFCLGNALNDMYNNHESMKICSQFPDLPLICNLTQLMNMSNPCCPGSCGDGMTFCATYQEDYLAWAYPGIGRALVFMALQGLVFFALILLGESGYISSCVQLVAGSTNYTTADEDEDAYTGTASVVGEDDDVIQERLRVLNCDVKPMDMQGDSLILQNLRKWYGDFLAVDRLCVGIPQGECFGLLGVNGAGKTSTFKMLTGDSTISSGDAYLYGYSVKSSIKDVQSHLGYCPQFDALIDQMTVRETLTMFGRLRGVDEQQLPRVVKGLVHTLLLGEHIDKQAGDLSGGNKRKLSTGIALIGDPPVIFLDEPTTGMDPVARRRLWDTLSKVRASGRTLVLTSHSMEECEALCTRLAIMVNGQFKCLGSPQHLKNKFGEGYTLLVKIEAGSREEMERHAHGVMNFIQKEFPGSQLKDLHQGYIHYQIMSERITWAKLFGTMERSREQYHIEDYSVSQTTLEQVFINFARAQLPPRESGQGCTTKCGNCCRFFCCCGCLKNTNRVKQVESTHF